MADSNITVSGLTPTSGTQQIKWKWAYNDPNKGGLPYLEFEAVEVWTASSNNRNLALASGQPAARGVTEAIEAGLSRGEIRFGWIRARNKAGGYGDWFPAGVTNGIEGRESSGDVLLETDGYWKLPNGLIFQWGTENAPGGEVDQFLDVTFPIAFPNAAFKVLLGTEADAGLGRAITSSYYSLTTTGFRLQSRAVLNNLGDADARVLGYAGSGGVVQITVSWMAIGY